MSYRTLKFISARKLWNRIFMKSHFPGIGDDFLVIFPAHHVTPANEILALCLYYGYQALLLLNRTE